MSTPPIILIVDDDSSHRAMPGRCSGVGYATDEADDGDTAVEKVKERAYDAVLDVRMACMDGISPSGKFAS